MKTIKLTLSALVTLCASFAVCADQMYTLQYAPNSPVKSVQLKNATLVLEIYDYEKPDGFRRIKTNANKAFFLDHSHDFEVVGIVGEKKQGARCSGFGTPSTQNITIRCEKF